MRKYLKRLITVFIPSWLAGAAMITFIIAQYAAEDFSLPDLLPMYLMLGVFGVLLTAAVSLPVMLLLQRRFSANTNVLIYPLVNTLLITSLVATASGVQAFLFENLPVSEAVTFTAAFAVMGFSSGLAFLRLSGEGWVRHWSALPVFVLLAVLAIATITFAIPFVEEALLASRTNGSVVRSVAMSVPRSAHTATLLPDGRVLLIGGMISVRGNEVSTATTDVFDPRTGTITTGGKLSAPRAGHTATLLNDGNVLVTGGGNEYGNLVNAELYRPGTGEPISVGSMTVARERHAATRLADGRVLITGGTIAQPSEKAEIYDPQTGTFSATAPMNHRRAAHSATLLNDGRVLIAGGAESLDSVLRSMEIYDPASNTFADAGQMRVSRYKHSAVLLGDGKVMLLGGSDERDWDGRRQSVEIYNPASQRSQLAAPLNRARFKFPNGVAITANGSVIVSGSGRRIEVYDEKNSRFVISSGSVEDEWFYATATLLSDGRIFIAGGYNSSLHPTNQAWIYQPPGESQSKQTMKLAQSKR